MLKFVVLALGAVGARADKLQYFGVWELEKNTSTSPASVAPWANFAFTSDDPAYISRLHTEGGVRSLLRVDDALLCDDGAGTGRRLLCTDFAARWAALLASAVRPLLASGALFGVNFGDELAWRCVPYSNITAMVDAVRADLPRAAAGNGAAAILYYNEAYPVFTDGQCSAGGDFDPHRVNISYPSVPAGLDWLSVDYYPDEGTAAGVAPLYERFIYPKLLGAGQRVLFVPPAYGSRGNASVGERLCCSASTRDGANPPCGGNCTEALLQWASAAYDWARADERVVGLNPWHWATSGDQPQFEPGLSAMPVLRAAYEAVGAEIVSGRLADIDFQLLQK